MISDGITLFAFRQILSQLFQLGPWYWALTIFWLRLWRKWLFWMGNAYAFIGFAWNVGAGIVDDHFAGRFVLHHDWVHTVCFVWALHRRVYKAWLIAMFTIANHVGHILKNGANRLRFRLLKVLYFLHQSWLWLVAITSCC